MKNLRPDPQHARTWFDKRKRDEDVWFYEEPEGISVCVSTDEGVHQAVIPLYAIRGYMERINSY